MQDLPSNKKFGYFFSIIFLLIAVYFYIKEINNLSNIFSFLGIIFFIISLIKSEILLPLNKLWMNIGYLLGNFVNPIVLGIIFFLMFVPIAISMRIFRRDELSLKFKDKISYWKKRENSNFEIDSFKQQF
jgi:hypothetical protein